MSLALNTRALALAGWQDAWNRKWRFSTWKLGGWILLIQLALVALLVWRLHGAGAEIGIDFKAVLMSAMSYLVLWGFLGTIMDGRMSLYAHNALPLIMTTPAAPASVLQAFFLGVTPGKAWSALLMTAFFKLTLAPELSPGQLILLWSAALAASCAGVLGGLATLVGSVWLSPRALGFFWVGATILIVVIASYIVYLLAIGIDEQTVSFLLDDVVDGVMSLGAIGVAIVGGVMGAGLALLPHRMGRIYKQGWMSLASGKKAVNYRRSRLPSILPGAMGAIQAKEWLRIARNDFAPIRVWLLAAAFGGSAFLGTVIDGPHLESIAVAVGIGAAILFMNELVATMFSAQGPREAWYVLAGLTPGKLLAGKLLAASPLALATGLCTFLASIWHVGSFETAFRLASLSAAIGCGMALLMVGLGALDVGKGRDSQEDSELMDAMMEQLPRGLGSWAGYLLAILFGCVAAWLVSDSVELGWFGTSFVLCLPALTLIPAYRRLRWFLN